MGKQKAPSPPDPKETAAAQTGTNVSTAVANAYLNNVNQVTPDGSLSYETSGTYSWTDPSTGETYEIPRFTATQSLSPQQQAIQDQSQGAELNLATLANNQSGFLNDYMAKPFNYDPGEHENWALGLYDKLNSENRDQGQEGLATRLSNQGIKLGSEAYDRAMQNYDTSAMNARDRFLLDSYNTGFNTASAERNQPINEITALLSGSQVSQPNFVNANMGSIPTTDFAGISANNYQQRLQQIQHNNQLYQPLMGGLFGLGAGALSGGVI